ncbi:MAG: 3-deoxy-8-phosphooctulonate synthase [Magnetococcales bacterium]|nr:3-deoxy-8-phosphooctulonate synthase [Magnetococcales bacterium]
MIVTDFVVVSAGDVSIGAGKPLAFLAGPCAMEGMDFALKTAEQIRKMAESAGVPVIYKSSFDKANRTSSSGYRGPGLEEGLRILEAVQEQIGLPVVTDVHEPGQAKAVASVVDLIQTPAFLCRQTDFIQAVANAGKPVNIKKGQFLAPEDMAKVAEKAIEGGNKQIMLCERGTTFGYRNLVVDMRGLVIMAETGFPVVFDATHSVQLPSGLGGSSGGERRFAPVLARAAVAVGVDAVFLETHPDPDNAPCDGPNMIPFDQLEKVFADLKRLDEATHS